MIVNCKFAAHEHKPSQFASRVYPTHLGLCVMWRIMIYRKGANKLIPYH